MATAKKLPSGSWRVQAYVGKTPEGKKIIMSFTADTKKEAEFLASEYLHTGLHAKDVNVARAIKEYIELNRKNFSPATVRGYDSLYRTAYEPILDTPIKKLNKVILQRWIKEYGAERSPKTVHNAFALLSAACKMQEYNLPEVKLPKKQKKEYDIPSDQEVFQIINYFREIGNHDMVLATMLGAFGQMRRGEVAALTTDDFIGNKVKITKDIVQNDKKEWVVKEPKTPSGIRVVSLPAFVIAELPKEKGKLFNCTPEKISNQFNHTTQRKLNMPYNFHSLRHYGTSSPLAHANELGLDLLFMQDRGGWKEQDIMMNVYRNAMPESFKASDDKLMAFFTSLYEKYN